MMIAKLKKIMGKGKTTIVLTGMALTLLMVFMYTTKPVFLQYFDNKIYDLYLELSHTDKVHPAPIIVDIDEESLKELGQWPWPRYRVALLLEKIRQAGVISIGLDILFAEADRTSPVVLQQELKRDLHVDVQFVGLPEALMDNDEVFASILANGPYVLGYYFDYQAEPNSGDPEEMKPLTVSEVRAPGAREAAAYLLRAPSVIKPLPNLIKAANGAGYINTIQDEDGLLRRTPLLTTWNGKIYPNLSLATLLMGMGKVPVVLKVTKGGIESLRIAKKVIPLDRTGNILMNYRGPGKTFPYYSAVRFLKDEIPAGSLEGKIAFIGTSAAGLMDLRSTPMDLFYPGVEVHATIVDNILSGDFISRPDWVPGLELSLILVFGLVSTLLITWSRSRVDVLAVFILGGCIWYSGLYFFQDQRIYVSPMIPLLTLMLIFAVLNLLKYMLEEKDKKFLKNTFSQYISPELIDNMYENKTHPQLGGASDIITAYFTDIQGFSSFSEKITAHQLVELLNEYLTVMTDILLDEQGTLDKYEGDAIIAFFGAPMRFEDHALRACRAAVEMQDRLLELRVKWAADTSDDPDRNTKGLGPEEWAPGSKWPKVVYDMRMRIGINTGDIVTGNMGSKTRMNYTMMGDSVNLAARLEAGAKQYGIFTIISEYTYNQEIKGDCGEVLKVADFVEERFIDNIQVVGKTEPVKVYELAAMKGELTEREETLFELFDEAMGRYLAMDWDAAIAGFTRCLEYERFPDAKTNPSEVYIKRCEMFKEEPPVAEGETWDGVFRLTSK